MEKSHHNGDLRVVDLAGRSVRLSKDYVAHHTQLGYASTVAAAQGTTVDTSHVVITAGIDRETLYVATSRARRRTHLYVSIDAPSPSSLSETPYLDARSRLDAAVTRSACDRSAIQVVAAEGNGASSRIYPVLTTKTPQRKVSGRS